MPFTVGYPSFYSTILGFLGSHWFPLFAPVGTKTNVVSIALVAGPFLILHYFPLLRFPLQKPLANFLILRGSRGLTFDLSFSMVFRLHLFRSTFWLLLFLSFFLNMLIPFYQAERSSAFFLHGPSFWVPPDLYSWVVSSQVFWSFSASLGVPPWTISILT